MIARNRWRSVRDTVKEMPVRITQTRTAPTVKGSQIGFFCFDQSTSQGSAYTRPGGSMSEGTTA